MESAVLCTKKRTAPSETESVSCHVTYFTTTDLGSETFDYSGFSTENTPIKYTDPTGRDDIDPLTLKTNEQQDVNTSDKTTSDSIFVSVINVEDIYE
jgi:hypothetical protein